jgi:hypothetical protein
LEHDDVEKGGDGRSAEEVVKHASRDFIESFDSADRDVTNHVAPPPSPFIDRGGSKLTDMPWCVPSIDIEAKVVREEGSDRDEELGVGIFGQEDVLQGEKGVKWWLGEIKRSLLEPVGVD